mmetsp:Transcript_7114/g.13261  ORF Transcript_7114/g.13261 Transcript_7114/m.13261 type:complete len:356 (+) Transcript_7114:289-1356(+)
MPLGLCENPRVMRDDHISLSKAYSNQHLLNFLETALYTASDQTLASARIIKGHILYTLTAKQLHFQPVAHFDWFVVSTASGNLLTNIPPLIQHLLCLPRNQSFLRQGTSFFDTLRKPIHIASHTSIENNRVLLCIGFPFSSLQDLLKFLRVSGWFSSPEIFDFTAFNTDGEWVKFEGAGGVGSFFSRRCSVFDLHNSSRPHRANFIQPHSMNHHSMIHPPHFLQSVRHQLQKILMEHTNHRSLRRSRIRHGSQDIKASSNPQLFANRSHGLHRRMIDRRKQKRNPTFFHALHHLRRVQIDLHPQRLEDIRRPATRRNAAISRLGDGGSTRRGEDDARGGDVDCIGTVAASSNDIE